MLDLDAMKELDLKQPYVWAATWFGSGFLKPAPGTWGSLTSIPFALALFQITGVIGLAVGTLVITVIGFWASKEFDKATDGHDNKMIVIDEAAGQWITLLPVFHFYSTDAVLIVLAFLLFRLLDITKPWPISHFDKKVEGAAGVMGDDIIAGIIGALVVTGIYYYVG